MNYPKYMKEFLELFHTEEQCLLYLEKLRWNWLCPKCNCKYYYRKKNKRVRICKWCKSTLSVTAWTILHRMRIELRDFLLICWFFVTSKQWISSKELSSILWLDEKTAWLRTEKIRKIMVLDDRTKLSWDVEIDEVFLWWHHSWKRWRWAEWKKIIIIAVEINMINLNNKWLFRWMWRVRIKVIKNCWWQTLNNFIENEVEKWTTIYTDKWKWYNDIKNRNYNHIIQTKLLNNEEILWINTDEVTPNVHIIASLLKRWLLGTHQEYLVKWWYLQDYLDEYTFRFNRRKVSNRWKLFKILLDQSFIHKCITRDEIKKQKKS